jgi:hypothetical protein
MITCPTPLPAAPLAVATDSSAISAPSARLPGQGANPAPSLRLVFAFLRLFLRVSASPRQNVFSPETHPQLRSVAFQAAMPPFVGAFFRGFPSHSTTTRRGMNSALSSASPRLCGEWPFRYLVDPTL